MQWLKNISNTLFVAFIVSIITLVTNTWVSPYFKKSNLFADIYVSEWQPFPTKSSVQPKDILKNTSLSEYAISSLNQFELNNFAIIIVGNSGLSQIDNATLQLGKRFDEYTPPTVIVVTSGKSPERKLAKETSDIKLPPIPPGRSVKVLIWSNLGISEFFFEKTKIFTPDSQVKLKLHKYEDYDLQFEDRKWTDKFIENWIPLILILSLLGMLGLTFVMAQYFEKYSKKILEDEKLYKKEQSRFKNLGKKFVPSLQDNDVEQ